MELLMSQVYPKIEIVDTKEPSVLYGMCDEELKYIDNVEPRYHLREDISDDDKYRWYEIIDGEIVKRNNIDPSLTADGLPTTETQLKQLEELDLERQNNELSEEDKLKMHRREMLQRIRCIALDAMGKNILFDPRKLQPKDKREFVKRVEELYILSEEEIINMFNGICQDSIFQCGADYSNYPVYDV
jgi:hypothetical protein